MNMKTPDITLAQITAALVWIGAQAVALGWINNETNQRLVMIGSTVVAVAWKFADAWIRGARNKRAAAEAVAQSAPRAIAAAPAPARRPTTKMPA